MLANEGVEPRDEEALTKASPPEIEREDEQWEGWQAAQGTPQG